MTGGFLQTETALQSTRDPISQGIVAAIIICVFVLLAREAAHRVLIAMTAVAVLWAITYLTPFHLMTFDGMAQALDFNVLVLLAAMMAVVGVLKTTEVFESAVARIMERAGSRPLAIVALVGWFTAIASAFLDNVTTVIVITPMVMSMARRMGIRPAALLLPMVMASNIGGTATLIGDPPNIMIGSGAHLSFLDFLEDLTLPCALMILWLEFYARRYYAKDYADARPVESADGADGIPQLTNVALARWMFVICAFILVGFLTHHLTGMPPAVPALIGAAAALVVQDVLYVRAFRPTAHERIHGILHITDKEIEWPTLAFFAFLFIAVGAAVQTGLIETVANTLDRTIEGGRALFGLSPNGTLLFAALVICWVSGFMSSLVDNIPFVAVSIPIIARLAPALQGDSSVLWWALSLGACLGGNGTIIGASANVTAVGLAERDGTRISFGEFARFGAPVAIGTLVISSAYLALHVYLGQTGSLLAMAILFAIFALARLAQRAAPTQPVTPRER
jgi:Na+/H+ antiporter NhaD/arsenite permease-like protein